MFMIIDDIWCFIRHARFFLTDISVDKIFKNNISQKCSKLGSFA